MEREAIVQRGDGRSGKSCGMNSSGGMLDSDWWRSVGESEMRTRRWLGWERSPVGLYKARARPLRNYIHAKLQASIAEENAKRF